VRPPPPQDCEREEAQHPRARQYDAAHGSDAAALHDRGQKLVAPRGQEREPEHQGENRRNAGKNGGAGVPARSAAGRLGSLVFERRVSDDGEREAAMPERIQPRRALGPGAEQACRREKAGEAERVRNGYGGCEQIAARKHEERARAQDVELAEQQHCRDQIVDHERGFVDRDKGPDLRERQLRERCRGEKDDDGREHDHQREPPLAAPRRQRRKEYAGLVRQPTRFHLRSSGSRHAVRL